MYEIVHVAFLMLEDLRREVKNNYPLLLNNIIVVLKVTKEGETQMKELKDLDFSVSFTDTDEAQEFFDEMKDTDQWKDAKLNECRVNRTTGLNIQFTLWR